MAVSSPVVTMQHDMEKETTAGPLAIVMLDEGTGILTALNVEERGHRNIGHRKIADAPNFKKGDFVKITSIDGELHLLQNKKFYKYSGQNWILKARLGDQPGYYAQLITSYSQDKVYLISKNTMVLYNVSNEIWSDPLPGSGLGMDVCLAASPDSIYAIGGALDWLNARRFDPDSERWLTVKTKKYGRRGAAATFHQDKIYVLGGATLLTNKNTVECYDPCRDEWTDLADMNTPRAWLAAAIHNDRLYAIGGWPERDTIEVYNHELKCWEEKEDIPKHEGKISVCVCKL